jgi:hypothetical protein
MGDHGGFLKKMDEDPSNDTNVASQLANSLLVCTSIVHGSKWNIANGAHRDVYALSSPCCTVYTSRRKDDGYMLGNSGKGSS